MTDAQLVAMGVTPPTLGVILILFWRWFASQKLGRTTDNATGQVVESQLKFSKESMEREKEATQRAAANYELYVAEQRRADLLNVDVRKLTDRVEGLEAEVLKNRKIIRNLATLISQLDEHARPYVQQFMKDSEYPPLRD